MTRNGVAAGPVRPLTSLTADELAWRDTVRDFAERRVGPLVGAMDAASELDPGLLADLFGAGLMGVEIPEIYGGGGHGLFEVVLTIEELARVDPAVAVLVDVQNALLVSALLRHGTGDLKRRYFPRLAAGTVGAYAISEEHAGSDAFAMSTQAERDGGHFVLDGRKKWTTNAAEAGLFLVFARTVTAAGESGRITAFLVERDSPGLAVGPRIGKMGIRASSTCDVVLDNVRVPAANVLGGVDQGDLLAVDTLTIGKIGIAAQLVGLAHGAVEAAAGYATGRRQFGEPIANFQGVRFPLAAVAAELAAARALLYNTVRMVEHGCGSGEVATAAAMAKYIAAEVAERAASQAVDTLGGNGFSTDHPVEKLYRDAKVGKIYEGTSNMQFRTIATALLRETAGTTA